MKSAFDCFQAAAKCDEHARNCKDVADRRAYQDAAQSWRILGALAKRFESGDIKVAPRAPSTPARDKPARE